MGGVWRAVDGVDDRRGGDYGDDGGIVVAIGVLPVFRGVEGGGAG